MESSPQATSLVTTWLRSLAGGTAEPDVYIAEYVASAICVCDADDHEAFSDLDNALTGLSEAYGGMEESARYDSLSDMVVQVKACLQTEETAGKMQGQATTAAAAAAAAGSSSQPHITGGRPHSAASSDRDTSGSGASSSPNEADEEALHQLLALCSGHVSRDYVGNVLEGFKGDLQLADLAEHLRNCALVDAPLIFPKFIDDLKAKEAAFQQRKAELAEQRRLEDIAKERNRQAIIERFALQEVKNAPLPKKGPVRDTITPAVWEKADQPKYRFVGGVAVAVKRGQKYVIEKTKEEWDGGSKGKVYTKGKRGKGFT